LCVVDDSVDIPDVVMTVVHYGTYRLKRGQFPAFWVLKNHSGAQSSFGRTAPFLAAAVNPRHDGW